MQTGRRRTAKRWLYPALILVLMAAWGGCHSAPGGNEGQESSEGGAAEASGHGGHIDVLCIGDRIDKPTEPFHYSYKYADRSGWNNDEADITPQAIDITTRDSSGSHRYHAVHSSEENWGSAVLVLAHLNFTVMSARLESLNGTAALSRQGADTVNNYSTTKYSVDTASASSSDRNSFETLFGKGSFERGTVWMGQDGCVVKLVLDEGLAQTDGSLNKTHYEISRTKK